MRHSKTDRGGAGRSTVKAKKSHKHEANLPKNSSLYFQIGLILCLLGTYALFEMQFQEKTFNIIEETAQVDKTIFDYVPPFISEVIKPKEPQSLLTSDIKSVFKVVEDNDPVIQAIIDMSAQAKPKLDVSFKVDDIKKIERQEEPLIVDFILVEQVPIYPGCDKYTNNDDRKKCMSKEITKLISKKFNVDIGSEYGIYGRQKIFTQFTIDNKGNVTDIKIRGPHYALENEAKRVIKMIPKMQPGLQRQVPVGVIYTLPILYDARN